MYDLTQPQISMTPESPRKNIPTPFIFNHIAFVVNGLLSFSMKSLAKTTTTTTTTKTATTTTHQKQQQQQQQRSRITAKLSSRYCQKDSNKKAELRRNETAAY
eukprot:TRINITY_DN20102_c1_g1_i1.p1 TRINITY_DN20102_c1_g1~~TRINITY_DN20102_c1_g1_i1.p1  ORF type:complete len:103 (+),score=25.20 TRINITY_DN20102_c1_g1_i1:155-463(+)